jgi:excisionase family DNA binding protein
MATRWLTPGEAARRLGVSESTVWRLFRREQLPSVKVGGRRRVAASALRGVVRAAGRVTRAADVAPLRLDDSLFELAGKFASDGRAPGSSDKHACLGGRR